VWSEGSVFNDDNELFTFKIGSIAPVFTTCYYQIKLFYKRRNSEICFINYPMKEGSVYFSTSSRINVLWERSRSSFLGYYQELNQLVPFPSSLEVVNDLFVLMIILSVRLQGCLVLDGCYYFKF
jgi:hypothetical protein